MTTTVLEDSSQANILGFWVYLMSDAVIFALLFATYATMGHHFPGVPSGRDLFELTKVFQETLLLLLSTMTCGLAMSAAQQQRLISLLTLLLVTLLLGCGFITMEIREFMHLASLGAKPSASGYWSAFFTLVGCHGLHVTIGIIWLLVMMTQLVVKGLTSSVWSRLYRFSLFWHFLDLIWIGIFSTVYLPGIL